MNTTHDIIIVGGGIVGLTLACALAQQTDLSLLILDAKAPLSTPPCKHPQRVSAITLASQRIFHALDVWDAIKRSGISPFTHIHVWDRDQTELAFSSQFIAEPVLGFIIANDVMQSSLYQKILSYPNVTVMAPVQLQSCAIEKDHIALSTTNQTFTAKLAVAADGARSWLREKANIPVEQYDYDQTAIVSTVSTALPHQKMARQVFLESGPLAFLPLQEDNLSSIVWSVPKAQGTNLLALDDTAFKQALSKAFYHLGEVLSTSPRQGFPLCRQKAKKYLSQNIVLVGDAAHTVHPLAGQGVNMGLLDAASLAEVIVEARQKGRDFANRANLRSYERWRKADNLGLFVGIDVIKKIFATKHPTVVGLRALGLSITNQTQWIKNFFIRHAVGERGFLPKLAMK